MINLTYKLKTDKNIHVWPNPIHNCATNDEAIALSWSDNEFRAKRVVVEDGEEFVKLWVEDSEGNVLHESDSISIRINKKGKVRSGG